MATDMTQELGAVIAARIKAAESPEKVREALRQTQTALNRLAGMVGAVLLVLTEPGWPASGRVEP